MLWQDIRPEGEWVFLKRYYDFSSCLEFLSGRIAKGVCSGGLGKK
jgi:hypothetical protein